MIVLWYSQIWISYSTTLVAKNEEKMGKKKKNITDFFMF